MRVLLSTFGSRGDVQPTVALGLALRDCGIRARLCAPPNFADLIAGHGLEFAALGFDLSTGGRNVPGGPAATVAAHIEAVGAAAQDCDAIVGCSAMQIAARSIADWRGVPYLYAVYAPVALPSPYHGPLPVYPPVEFEDTEHLGQWDRDAQWWNDTWAPGLNAERAALGLAAVHDVRDYVITDRPMLAADPTLAPWQTPAALDVVQTGAWWRADERPLAPEVETFLERGGPPIYFGFGSMLKPRASIGTMIAAARALGRRAIVLRGWAELDSNDGAGDWLAVGEVNQQELFTRAAAVVHHGGCGTVTNAALAGVPHVVVPHHYDQPYYAQRVAELGIGVAHHKGEPTEESLVEALERALAPTVVARARELRTSIRTDGTAVAAREILRQLGSTD